MPAGRSKSGEEGRQLSAAIGIVVDDQARRVATRLHFQSKPVIIGASHDQRPVDAPLAQGVNQRAYERATVGRDQQRLRLPHARRSSSREDQSRYHPVIVRVPNQLVR